MRKNRSNRRRGRAHARISRPWNGRRWAFGAKHPAAKTEISVGVPHPPTQEHELVTKCDERGKLVFASMGEERPMPRCLIA